MAHLKNQVNFGDNKPTNQANELKTELEESINGYLEQWSKLKSDNIPEFNSKVKDLDIDAIVIKKKEEEKSF